MLTIARRQLVEGLTDARFIFIALLAVLAFIANALIFTERLQLSKTDYSRQVAALTEELNDRADNLQSITNFAQKVMVTPSPYAFIAAGGSELLPNTFEVNAFMWRNPERMNRGNEILGGGFAIDWVFIVSTVMSLLAILLGFGAVCGEKQDGTLKLVLTNSISRLSVFTGKYLGLLMVLFIALIIGICVNLLTLSILNAITFSSQTLLVIGWALLFSMLTLSAVLLLSMAFSSMTAHPPVALVSMIIVWTLLALAVPGIASLIGRQFVDVPTPFETAQENAAATEEAWDNAAPLAGQWRGDPFAESIPGRADLVQNIIAATNRITHEAQQKRIRQLRTVEKLSWISPFRILDSAVQTTSVTGLQRFEALYASVRQYKNTLHDYTVERDRLDSDSPHLVYSWGTYSDPGVFSKLPVDMSGFPRFEQVWSSVHADVETPLLPLLLLIAVNTLAATWAFILLARYDPR